MRFLRVDNPSVLQMEIVPWRDSGDSCIQEDGEIVELRDSGIRRWKEIHRKTRTKDAVIETQCPNHSPRQWSHDRGNDCRLKESPSKGCRCRENLYAKDYRGSFPCRENLHAKDYRGSKSGAQHGVSPGGSSARCYAPRDEHRSGKFEGASRRSGGQRETDRVREMEPAQRAERGFVGTKRSERDAGPCDAAECKRHSKRYGNQKQACGRLSTAGMVKNPGAKESKHALREKSGEMLSNAEAGGEQSQGKVEEEIRIGDESLEERGDAHRDNAQHYEMLASLLLDGWSSALVQSRSQIRESMDFENSYTIQGAEEGRDNSKREDMLSEPQEMKRDGAADRGNDSPACDDKQDHCCSDSLASSDHQDRGLGELDAGKSSRFGVANRKDAAKSTQAASRVFVDVSNKFKIDTAPVVKEQFEENDCHRLSQRQRQIDFGKNTLGYERYIELVPRSKRVRKDPHTPNLKQVCSKRSWDGQIRKWRRLLHAYDPPKEDDEELAEEFNIGTKLCQGDTETRNTVNHDPRRPDREVNFDGGADTKVVDGQMPPKDMQIDSLNSTPACRRSIKPVFSTPMACSKARQASSKSLHDPLSEENINPNWDDLTLSIYEDWMES